jgi:signal transduction histidine kinase/CheY-like chemotaxis protein
MALMRRGFRLRTKILGFLLGIGVATLGAFVLLVQPMLLSAVDQIVMRETRQELETVADSLLPFLIQNQFAGIHENLDELRKRQPNWRRIELLGEGLGDGREGGRHLYPLRAEPPLAMPGIETFEYDIRFRDATVAKLTAYVDFTEDRTRAQKMAFFFFVIIAVVFTAAMLLVALFLELTVGRRARELSRAADRLARRDYEALLPTASTDEIGDLVHSFANMRDAVRNYETSLHEARSAAETSNLAKSNFLSMMSHEIRTPMNGILGMAQMLMMPNLKAADQHDYARTILTSGQSLLALLNDILDFSKIEAGKFQLESSVFEPGQILHETQALFSAPSKDKKLQIDSRWHGPADQRYQTDAHRVRQMLANLVGNAIKFTTHGYVRIEGAEIGREGDLALLEFSVTDSGIGIPQGKLALLFQPFIQADSSTTREYGGTGLGLSIVRSLATLMGGEVGVESKAGKGSRFWFRIRAEILSVGKNRRQITRQLEGSVGPAVHCTLLTGHVLVVEDNLINCKVVEAMLKQLGLSVTLVHDGQQAVELITRGGIQDIVLMDLQMPVLDGCAATEQIRRWEAENVRPRLPIIALTADAFEEDRARCMAVGMDDFLTKPLALDVLSSVLGNWLRAEPGILPANISGQPVDLQRLVELVEEITPLLAQNKFDAISRCKALQALLAGTDAASEINEISALLAEFRFDVALDRLQQLVVAQTECVKGRA